MDLLVNDFLFTSLLAWLSAQTLKVFINMLVIKEWDWKRFIGDGGMPSAHSATVSSLACISLLTCGIDSFEFAVSTVLAIIVCRDAMGVRKETEKQAVILNEIIKNSEYKLSEKSKKLKLKEMVGHTASEVVAGVLLGIIVACIVYSVFTV